MSILDLFKRKNEVEGESAFNVKDRGYEKVLGYGSIPYSKFREGSIYTKEYWDYFLPMAYVYDKPRVLLIGFGGGTVAFQLSALLGDSVSMDGVDISKRVVELSREFIPNTKANITIGDGAAYVRDTVKKYDLILVDAYTSRNIPDQFLGSGFIQDAHAALSGDGMLAMNYAMGFMGAARFSDYVLKLKEGFHAYRVHTALTEANVIVIGSKKLGKEEMLARIRKNMDVSSDNSFLLDAYEEMTPV